MFSSILGFSQDAVADNMLLYQRSVGGWPKHINNVKVDYDKVLSVEEKAGVADDRFRNDATIDNQATTKEIRYLAKAFKATGNQQYLQAAEKGIEYLLEMQYDNGGFPQFYPDSSSYRGQITFNDNAMINALTVLWDVANRRNGLEVVKGSLVVPAQLGVQRGIDCILRTQIMVNGKRTAWCAQYDQKTLKPAKARAFELPSISGSESVGIVRFLMKVEKPTEEVQQAVCCAVTWLKDSRIEGFKYTDITGAPTPNGKDRVLVAEPGSVVWARFYNIESNKPFFTGRDGVPRASVAEIEHERRTGYAWYGTWADDLLEKEYPKWLTKNGLK